MHRRVEPLAALVAASGAGDWDGNTYESISRELLQNGVHDCLCGVSIDQVHERMERSYRRILAFADERQRDLASSLLNGFADGRYAVASAAMPLAGTIRTNDGAVQVDTTGIGITQTTDRSPIRNVDQPVDDFEHRTDHFVATASVDGLAIDGRPALRLLVVADAGDTYSSEPGEVLGELRPTAPVRLLDETSLDRTVRMQLGWSGNNIDVRALSLIHI